MSMLHNLTKKKKELTLKVPLCS